MESEFEKPDFKLLEKEFSTLMRTLPKQIGAMAERFFKESFENQGFTNHTLQPWKSTKSGKSNTFGSKSSGILIGTATLKRAITYSASKNYVEVSVDGNVVPYAKIHNEGGIVSFNITAKSRKFFWFMYYRTNDQMWKGLALTKKTKITFRMPKRQFIGESAMLNKDIDAHIQRKLSEIERKLDLFKTK